MNENPSNRYQQRGVSAAKTDVHAAVEKLDKGLFPKAFCKVTSNIFAGGDDYASVIHSDGSGTKSILAYLHYKETGDASVFKGIAQDSIVMNIDDMLCVGVTDRILLSSTINRNASTCDKNVIAAIIQGNEEFLQAMRDQGLDIVNGGGETADMGDLVRTVTVDTCAVAQIAKKDVIGEGIGPNLSIVGLSSTGKASYEKEENSGIGSNGLTSARHDILCSHYRETYPEAYAPETNKDLVYCGPYRMSDALEGSTLTIGQALLSPTRSYAPVIHRLLKENRSKIKGLVHNTGGALSKCLRFGNDVHFVKDDLFDLPPIFNEIKKASGASWQEMCQVFNLGQRLEVYVEQEDVSMVIDCAKSYNIDAKVIGQTKPSSAPGVNELTVKIAGEELSYKHAE